MGIQRNTGVFKKSSNTEKHLEIHWNTKATWNVWKHSESQTNAYWLLWESRSKLIYVVELMRSGVQLESKSLPPWVLRATQQAKRFMVIIITMALANIIITIFIMITFMSSIRMHVYICPAHPSPICTEAFWAMRHRLFHYGWRNQLNNTLLSLAYAN